MKRLNTYLNDDIYDKLHVYVKKKQAKLRESGCSTSLSLIINASINEYLKNNPE